jgi:integrase
MRFAFFVGVRFLSTHASWYAATFGPLLPEWYAFPFCRRAKPIDPTRPVRSLKKAWGSVCEKAGDQCRVHDLRHTVCTKMAEAGVPEGTMLDIMGHRSAAVLRRYGKLLHRNSLNGRVAQVDRAPAF